MMNVFFTASRFSKLTVPKVVRITCWFVPVVSVTYLRQITAHAWEEEHAELFQSMREDMLPQLDLVVYSDDWAEIDQLRSAPVRDDVTGQEESAWRQKIEYQLDQKLTLEFLDNDIAEVVTFLQQNTNVNIVLDPEVLADDPGAITMTVADMQLRNVLILL